MSTPPPQILIVDDNKDALDVLGEVLTLQGFSVLQAASGAQALQIARAALPQAILMDLGLPGISGVDVARELRADPRFATTFIAALTGFGDARNRREALDGGFDDYLVKPVDLQALFAKLQARLGTTGAAAG